MNAPDIRPGNPAGRFWNDRLREPRIGVMLHYDASKSDAGSVAWLQNKNCKAGYGFLVLDDGTILSLAPQEARAWHAGRCRPSDARMFYTDANSAFYGVSVAATIGDVATYPQGKSVERLCEYLFRINEWNEPWRLTTHKAEAWPRGRKSDPGSVLPVELVREGLTRALRS